MSEKSIYTNTPCEKCGKPLKSFTSIKRTSRNYKERPLHLKCWKENQFNTSWITEIYYKNKIYF